MPDGTVDVCVPVEISDEDVYEAMKDIPGYLEITPGDFKEVYLKAYRHAVLRLTRSIKAADVMTRDVATVTESTPLAEVARLMAERKVSGLPVATEDAKPVGVISEKDILAAMSGGKAGTFMDVVNQCLGGDMCLAAPISAKCAADIMTSPPITVREDTPLVDVADIFTQKRINRVPVVDREGRLVGIVSRADVVRSSLRWEG